jgi:hypothetical protein
MLKIWPMIGLGLAGILLAWMITELIHIEPLKFRIVFIVFVGLLGSLLGWKFSSRA